MKPLIILFALFFVVPVFAQDVLVGFADLDPQANPSIRELCDYNPYYGCAPEADGYVWKTFRAIAAKSGYIGGFSVFIVNGPVASDGLVIPAQVGWAVYEDNNGRVGLVKASGYFPQYRLHRYSENILELTFAANTYVERGKNYWITFHTSLGDQITIQRGRERLCAPSIRRFSQVWEAFTPPSPENFTNTMANGCYAWAAIEATSPPPQPTQRCYCPTCRQQIPCSR